MKLLMFRDKPGKRLGTLREGSQDEVVDLVDLAGFTDMLGLIDAGDEGLDKVRRALSSSARPPVRKLTDLTLLPPLEPRGNVLGIGRNYGKHATESARAWGEQVQAPTVFTKAQTALTGPFDDIAIDPAVSEQMDWEAELGVVIGRTALNVKPEGAMRHVFGYTVINDMSARDVQHGWGGQYFKGKSVDASSPVGPWIVTADEIPDPQNLAVLLRVNGILKQDGNTRDMIYPVAQVIAWLSIGMTLRPGTLIASGTPDGVGFARTPPQFLRVGDLVETEVERIGMLRNRMVPPR